MSEIKDVSNTYEVVTLKETKTSKKVVDKVISLSENQFKVLCWELIADKTRVIREKAMLNFIKEIEENVK